MKEFKGIKGKWKHSKIANEIIEGTDSSKILDAGYSKVIGKVNATHKEEGYANLKLIASAPELLQASIKIIKAYNNSFSKADVFKILQLIDKDLKQAVNKALK